jgi:hypothetical protein
MDQESTEPQAQEAEAQTQTEGQEPEGQPEAQSFDADYVKKLRREAASERSEKKKLEARVKEFEDAHKSETERLQEERDGLRSELAKEQAERLRQQVALEKGISGEYLDFLTGESEEELNEKADRLRALMEARQREEQTPDFDPGVRQSAPVQSPAEAHNDLILGLTGRKT